MDSVVVMYVVIAVLMLAIALISLKNMKDRSDKGFAEAWNGMHTLKKVIYTVSPIILLAAGSSCFLIFPVQAAGAAMLFFCITVCVMFLFWGNRELLSGSDSDRNS